MKLTGMTAALALLGAFAAGGAAGWLGAHAVDAAPAPKAPEQWVARIGDQYISAEAFVDEMELLDGDLGGAGVEVGALEFHGKCAGEVDAQGGAEAGHEVHGRDRVGDALHAERQAVGDRHRVAVLRLVTNREVE